LSNDILPFSGHVCPASLFPWCAPPDRLGEPRGTKLTGSGPPTDKKPRKLPRLRMVDKGIQRPVGRHKKANPTYGDSRPRNRCDRNYYRHSPLAVYMEELHCW